MKPIAQDSAYHHFADGRTLLSIPNCWNVLSNLPFFIIGSLGMLWSLKKDKELRISNFMFFVGIFLTGAGSSYYHLTPDNDTLIWDRLPMTITFMSFFSIIISEFIDHKYGKILLWPLLFIGMSSVFYWKYFGDLRFYALVQFLPIILMIVIVTLFNKKNGGHKYLLWMILFYALAKVFEATDVPIFECGNLISGHSLKHFFAAAAPLVFLIKVRRMGAE